MNQLLNPAKKLTSHAVQPLCAVLLLAAACAPALGQAPETAKKVTLLIHAGRALDVRAGQYLEDAGILIQDGTIAEVGKFSAVRPHAKDAKLIDLGRATLLPGLIDCHTHLLMTERLQNLVQMSTAERALFGAAVAKDVVEAGITTVRDLGNSAVGGDVALGKATRAGWVVGPRVIASTRALSPIGGQFSSMDADVAPAIVSREYVPVSNPEDARRAVAQAVFAGADVIKVIVDTGLREDYTAVLDDAVMRAIVDEAHRSHRKVAAHAISNVAVRTAILAGVDSVEHAYFASDSNLQLMKEKGTFLVPTDSENPPAFYTDRLKRARALGVKIAFGSDARGAVLLQEGKKTFVEQSLGTLVAYERAGFTPAEIIRLATVNAANLLGWEDAPGSMEPAEKKFSVNDATRWQDRLGAIEPGRHADLIAVVGDPLQDITELTRVRFVMKQGAVVKNTLQTAASSGD